MKYFWISILVIAFLIGNFLVFFRFGNRDLVYLIDPEASNERLVIEGLAENQELESDQGIIWQSKNLVITNDLVEIKAEVPENFAEYNQVEVELEFVNESNPTLELGIKKATDWDLAQRVYEWDYHYLDNQYLNNYLQYLGRRSPSGQERNWQVLEDQDQGLTLFYDQASGQKKYGSVGEFIANPPGKINQEVRLKDLTGETIETSKAVSQIASVGYNLPQNYDFAAEDPETFKDNVDTFIPYTFRADLHLFVYFDRRFGDELELNFEKQDINATSGLDQYELKVYDQKQNLVYYRILDDDGIEDQSRTINKQLYTQVVTDLPTGGYYVDFNYRGKNQDSMIRNLNINRPRVLLNDFLIFDREDFLVENLINKPFTFYASKGGLRVYPDHDFSEQNVLINGTNYYITQTDPDLTNIIYLSEPQNEVVTTENDLEIRHEDNFVTTRKNVLFDMYPQKTKEFLPNDFQDNYNFLIARYLRPEIQSDNTKKVVKTFRNLDLDLEAERYLPLRFRAEGLEGYGNEIEIKSLQITLKK
jgi:hypothetical protein